MSRHDGSPPGPGSLGSKVYFRIGEVANLVGVEPHVLRYWEREFRSIRPTKSAKGQRVYSRKDVETLLRVKELLYGQGFTIAGARRKLRDKSEEGIDPLGATAEEDDPQATALEPVAALRVSPARAPRVEVPFAAPRPATDPHGLLREHLVTVRSEVTALLRELSPRK